MNNLENHTSEKEKIVYYEFLNFLEVLIHTILYIRNVYHKEAFFAFQIYNLNLKFISDDTICSYIQDVKSIHLN
jgi:hypothetical protein